MTDEQLKNRANHYARNALLNHAAVHGSRLDEADLITLIARAFVIGFAAGIEDANGIGRRRK